jgi:hypothetical protein
MTTRQAITILRRMLKELPFYGDEYEALKLAISALYVYKYPKDHPKS